MKDKIKDIIQRYLLDDEPARMLEQQAEEIQRLKEELRHALDFDPDGMVSKIKQQAAEIDQMKQRIRAVERLTPSSEASNAVVALLEHVKNILKDGEV